MSKNKTYEFKINRNKYKDIKSMDHSTMEDFLTDVYVQGIENGVKKTLQNAKTDIDYDVILSILLNVKGIGEKKAEGIIEELKANEDRITKAGTNKEQ